MGYLAVLAAAVLAWVLTRYPQPPNPQRPQHKIDEADQVGGF